MIQEVPQSQRFTIITVCRNSQDFIEETVQSVISQEYDNFEYIIVDGSSEDSTIEKIQAIVSKFPGRIRLISEKDNGIYDAMNKGIKFVETGYVYFLNSGDTFYDSLVLRNVNEVLTNERADILFGNYMKNSVIKKELVKTYGVTRFRFLLDRMICHQAIFAEIKALNRTNNFNLRYKISADFDWLINCYLNKCIFLHTSLIICNYDSSGISSRSHYIIQKEHEEIIKNHFGLIALIFSKTKHFLGNILRKHISKKQI